MDSLFSVAPSPGTEYEWVHQRALEVDGAEARLNRMRADLSPYLDPAFESHFRVSPRERAWELLLGATLLRRGFQLQPKRPAGPDFKIRDANRTVWIEATAPSSGNASDGIPVPPTNAMFDYPERQIVLRIRGAIDQKLEQFRRFAAGGAADDSDPFVIAINGMRFHTIIDMDSSPAILKAVMPIGAPQLVVNRFTGEVVDNRMEFRPTLLRDSGSEVATTCFLDSNYSRISAVAFTDANFLMDTDDVEQLFTVVRNPLAANPLPAYWFGFGREFSLEITDNRVSWDIVDTRGDRSG